MTVDWVDHVTPLDQANMNLLEQTTRKGVANGYAALGADGKVPAAQLPPIPPLVITDADIPATITRDTELAAGLATKADTAALAATNAAKVDRDSVVVAGARLLASKLLAGDAQAAFYLGGGGDIAWGAGGATAPDNHLYRRGTDGWLRLDAPGLSIGSAVDTDLGITAHGNVISNVSVALAALTMGVGPNGQAGLVFGAGGLNLYRKAGDTLAATALLIADDAGGAGTVRIGGSMVLFGGDSRIERTGANALRTPGSFSSQADVFARSGGASQVWIGDVSGKAGISLGFEFLYRQAAGIIRTDGTLDANALTINGVAVGGAGAALPADTVIVAGTRIIANKLVAGDAQPVWRINGDGKSQWGPGGATALDTTLYRLSANMLKTDGGLQAVGGVVAFANSPFPTTLGNGIDIGGDTNLYRSAANTLKTDGLFVAGSHVQTLGHLMCVSDTGKLFFGAAADTNLYRAGAGRLSSDSYLVLRSGTADQVWLGQGVGPGGQAGMALGAAVDVNLYRAAAANLKTDGSFSAGQSIVVDTTNGSNKVYWGSALDVNLYRLGAGILKTDGQFRTTNEILGPVGPSNESGLRLGGDTTLYRSAANVLKIDGQLYAGSYVAAAQGAAGQATSGAVGPSGAAGIQFGAAGDATLYRPSANALQTDGVLNVFGAGGSAGFTGLGLNGNGIGNRTVQIGAVDSGGAGRRMLSVPN